MAYSSDEFIVPCPSGDLRADMIETGELRLVGQFARHPPVNTIGERILGWFSRGRILPIDFGGSTQFVHDIGG